MSKTNSAVLRCHFHWLLDQRSASNRETTLRIYLKIIKRACVCVCVHLKAQGEHEPYFIGRRIFTLRYFIHWTIHGINISSTLFGYITVSFFLPLYFYSCGYKCNMNPATNAKPNNGTLKILIASLPTHSYEHTQTKKTQNCHQATKQQCIQIIHHLAWVQAIILSASFAHCCSCCFTLLFLFFYSVLYSCNLI